MKNINTQPARFKNFTKNLDITILQVVSCKTMFSFVKISSVVEDTGEGICYTELNRFHHEPDLKSTVSMGRLPECRASLVI